MSFMPCMFLVNECVAPEYWSMATRPRVPVVVFHQQLPPYALTDAP
jgi:hypothetical protein